MATRPALVCGVGLGIAVLLLGWAAPAQTPRPREEGTLIQRLAKSAKLPEENANRFWNALGPVLRDELASGREVSLPGVGNFRVVRVEAHRDLVNGRPTTFPATNTVEFVPSGVLKDAANSPSAVPAETVPEFKYIPLPGQTPSQQTLRMRVVPLRTP